MAASERSLMVCEHGERQRSASGSLGQLYLASKAGAGFAELLQREIDGLLDLVAVGVEDEGAEIGGKAAWRGPGLPAVFLLVRQCRGA